MNKEINKVGWYLFIGSFVLVYIAFASESEKFFRILMYPIIITNIVGITILTITYFHIVKQHKIAAIIGVIITQIINFVSLGILGVVTLGLPLMFYVDEIFNCGGEDCWGYFILVSLPFTIILGMYLGPLIAIYSNKKKQKKNKKSK